MAEELRIKNGDKQEMYETLLPQIASLVGNETDLIANMANIAAALKQTFGFFWVGFYRVIDNQLVLAPFKALSPVHESNTEKGSAARPGRRPVRSSYRT